MLQHKRLEVGGEDKTLINKKKTFEMFNDYSVGQDRFDKRRLYASIYLG